MTSNPHYKAPASGAFSFRVLLSSLFVALLLSTLLIYRPGLGGTPLIDDTQNLNGIAQVEDADSALRFLAEGHGTPLGRPIALASFFINHHAWPSAPDRLLWVNVCIHALNGALVFYLLYLISAYRQGNPESAGWIALLATAFWLLSPLLASSSLTIIQRMTTLSASFLLAGLVVFVKGRLLVDLRPRKAAILMTLGVCAGTLLSSFTKENGVLLPLFALTIDRLLIHGESRGEVRWLRYWRWMFLGLPLLLVAGYILLKLPNIIASYQYRHFDLTERLLTEARILWSYLFDLIAPRALTLGPFHDDIVVSRSLFSPPTTFFSVLGWISALALALRFRHRAPLVAFALTWFLGGHLLESTVFSLELYFEHRNYLPSIGLYFAVASLVFAAPLNLRRLLIPAAVAFLAIEAFTLYQVTAAWGKPAVAARLWHQGHPTSARATQYLSQKHLEAGNFKDAVAVIDAAWAANPARTGLALQSLQVRCPAVGAKEFDKNYARVQPVLENGMVSYAAVDAIGKMVAMHIGGECADRPTARQIQSMIDKLTSNHGFRGAPTAMFQLYHQSARLHLHDGRLDAAISRLEQAFEVRPDLDTALFMAGLLANAGQTEAALRKLEDCLRSAPKNPILRTHWETLVYEQKARVRAAAEQRT